MNILLSSTETIPGYEITELLDVVRGSTVRARNVGKDFTAMFRNFVGGEVTEYTKLMAQAREQALDRMIADAERLNADAIVNVRFTTAMVMQGCSEILAYGTAVRLSRL
ncbi:YbjQ family protein [Membranihabitans marinus]|uniref:YbjQ family protein n=1 Tax=Membranihabitans marinus TaxID=1227546 RepID=UPI001F397EE4|nr:YbjQ family protein [Membranihabitans marinus]